MAMISLRKPSDSALRCSCSNVSSRACRAPPQCSLGRRKPRTWRSRALRVDYTGKVAAITGSAGKTTTKEFLAQLLAARYNKRVLSAPENENNELGVSKLLLRCSNDAHDVLVIEMGARHYGDVAALVEIARPQIGILTNVGDAHLEIMGSRERLEETKWALFSRGARAVLNAADAVCRLRAGTLAEAPAWFAAENLRSIRSSDWSH